MELARRRGDRNGALKALDRLVALPSSADGDDDLWWSYAISQARNADELLLELWKPFEHEAAR